MRSRVANLKDKKNPKLKEGVIMGLIPPERIANMSAEVCYHGDLYYSKNRGLM